MRSNFLAETRVVECCARFTIYDRMHWPPSNSKSFGMCKSYPLKCTVMLRSLYALLSTTALSNICTYIVCMLVGTSCTPFQKPSNQSGGYWGLFNVIIIHMRHARRSSAVRNGVFGDSFAVPDAATLGPTVWVRIQSSLMFQFKSK